MSVGEVALLVVVAAMVSVSLLVARRHLSRVDSEIQAYRLYEVRDDLVFLVANGNLEESSRVFRTFYESVNRLVGAVDRMNLKTLLAELQRQRRVGKDPAERRRRAQLQHELKRLNDPEVNQVVGAYYMAIGEILYENSLLLRLISHRWVRRVLDMVFKSIYRRPDPPPQYEFWKDYRRAAHGCG